MRPDEVIHDIGIVSVAAPNLPKGDKYDEDAIEKTIRNIMLTPNIQEDDSKILICGAWGCGAFGNRPDKMAERFVRVLKELYIEDLYTEVHFAIPPLYDDNRHLFGLAFR